MSDRINTIIAALVVALLALILVGGTVAGWLLGRDPPNWLIGFDGVIITAAFGGGAFFALARTAAPTAALASAIQDDHHELAMNLISQIPNMTNSGIVSETANTEAEHTA